MSQSSKSSIKKILGSRIFLFFALLALIGLAIKVGRESYHKHQLSKEINRLESEIKQLEGRNRYLSNLMEYFKEDSYLEQQAKLKLNLKKPGENVVVIEHSETGKDSEEIFNNALQDNEIDLLVSDKETEAVNHWQWWEYFFGE